MCSSNELNVEFRGASCVEILPNSLHHTLVLGSNISQEEQEGKDWDIRLGGAMIAI